MGQQAATESQVVHVAMRYMCRLASRTTPPALYFTSCVAVYERACTERAFLRPIQDSNPHSILALKQQTGGCMTSRHTCSSPAPPPPSLIAAPSSCSSPELPLPPVVPAAASAVPASSCCSPPCSSPPFCLSPPSVPPSLLLSPPLRLRKRPPPRVWRAANQEGRVLRPPPRLPRGARVVVANGGSRGSRSSS